MKFYTFFKKDKKILFFALIGCAIGCQKPDEAFVQAKVAENVAAFRKKKHDECRVMLLKEAGRKADSLLLAEAQAELQDSLLRARPFRPEEPPVVPPIDTLVVKPIF